MRRRPLSEGEEEHPSLKQVEDSISEKTPVLTVRKVHHECPFNHNVSCCVCICLYISCFCILFVNVFNLFYFSSLISRFFHIIFKIIVILYMYIEILLFNCSIV